MPETLGAGKIYAAVTFIESHNLPQGQVKAASKWTRTRSSKRPRFYAVLSIKDRSNAEFEVHELVAQDKKVANIPMIFFANPRTTIEIKLYKGNSDDDDDDKDTHIFADTQVPLQSLDGEVALTLRKPGPAHVILVFALNAASNFQKLPGTSDSEIEDLKRRLEPPAKLVKAFGYLCTFIEIGVAIAELNEYAKVALGVVSIVSSAIKKYIVGKELAVSLVEDIGDICREVTQWKDEKYGPLQPKQEAACQALFPVIYKCLHYVCTLGRLDLVGMSVTRTVKECLEKNGTLLKKAFEKVKSARLEDTQIGVFDTLYAVCGVDEKLINLTDKVNNVSDKLDIVLNQLGASGEVRNNNCGPANLSHATAPLPTVARENTILEVLRSDGGRAKSMELYQIFIESLVYISKLVRSFSSHFPASYSMKALCSEADDLLGLVKSVAQTIDCVKSASPMFAFHSVFEGIQSTAFTSVPCLQGLEQRLRNIQPHQHLLLITRKSGKIRLLLLRIFNACEHESEIDTTSGCEVAQSLHHHFDICRKEMIRFLAILIASGFITVFDIRGQALKDLTSSLTSASFSDIRTHHLTLEAIWIREPTGIEMYSIPLSFCKTWGDFQKVIYQCFKDTKAVKYIYQGKWAIVPEGDNTIIDQTSSTSLLKPGKRFDIGVIVELLSARTSRTCPQCGHYNKDSTPVAGWIQCTDIECQKQFRIFFDPLFKVSKENRVERDVRRQKNDGRHRNAPEDKGRNVTPVEVEMIQSTDIREIRLPEESPYPRTKFNRILAKVPGNNDRPFCIIVMGVSGTGKSTLGSALAVALGVPFIDGDDLHPESNVNKMASGQPLNDTDRESWLELIRTRAKEICNEQKEPEEERILDGETSTSPEGVVIACSSLKRSYRDILRGETKPANRTPEHLEPPHPDALGTYFAFIKGDRETLMDRIWGRQGRFMKANMLDSQLNTLESPEGEGGVIVVDARQTTEEQVETIRAGLRKERQKAN